VGAFSKDNVANDEVRKHRTMQTLDVIVKKIKPKWLKLMDDGRLPKQAVGYIGK